MKVIALIPGRLKASRFPEKLLADIKGKTVIRRTYESAVKTGLFDEVVVVADDDRIIAEVQSFGGKAVKSKKEYESGTDRIAEAAEGLEADVFLNVQGDEPFINREPLEKLLAVFREDAGKQIGVASIVEPLNEEDVTNPNFVKVVLAKNGNALYFSRSPIPYLRDKDVSPDYYRHIGVYAFRKEPLLLFPKMGMTPLEKAEKIECLRFLENGITMKMVVTHYGGVGIDVPGDIDRAIALMDKMGWE